MFATFFSFTGSSTPSEIINSVSIFANPFFTGFLQISLVITGILVASLIALALKNWIISGFQYLIHPHKEELPSFPQYHHQRMLIEDDTLS